MTRRPVYALQGDLGSFPAAIVFQMAALAGADGVLTLRSPRGSCSVWFQRGKLVFARGPGSEGTLGEELVHRGIIERAACEAAAAERARRPGGPRIGSILVERGHIGREALEALIRERIKDAIYTVLEWHEGRFVFETGASPEEEDILLDVGLESLLLECMARIDDTRRRGREAGERRV